MPPKSFFWINKDSNSAKLSQSSIAEDRQVRRHVQCGRISNLDRSKSTRPESKSTNRRARQRGQQLFTILDSTCTPTVPRSLDLFGFLNSEEHRSLDFFVRRTAREWPGWDDALFWNTEVLQAGQRNNSVIHGLVALSAVHESLETSETKDGQRKLQCLALTQLNKSFSLLKANQFSYFEGLMTCLVLICFHNVQNGRQSYQLLRSGEMMLRELDAKTAANQVFLTWSEARVLTYYIRPLFARLRARLCMIGDPSSALALSMRERRFGKPQERLPDIPQTFKSLKDARCCLQDILGWGHDNLASSTTLETSRREKVRLLRGCCSHWESALQQLSGMGLTLKEPMYQKSMKLMQISCLFGRILLETSDTGTEIVFDDYVTEFAAIMQMVGDISREGTLSGDRSFGIDSGLVDIVAFVGKKCRDPIIRRAAMNFLARGHRFEGDRATLIAARIQLRLMEEEEEGLIVSSCHDIPECKRWRILQGNQFHSLGQLRLDLVQSPHCISSDGIKRSIWIPLPQTTPSSKFQDLGHQSASAPNIVFGQGYMAFLEDGPVPKYYRIQAESFYFPIPRV